MDEMEKSKKFTDLIVWQKAHKFVLEVYKCSAEFPKFELYGLTSQLRRAAVSIPANIVEGFAKKGKPDKLRYYNISEGSINECTYYLILAKDLGYLRNEELNDLLEETSKLLNAYSRSLRQKV